MKKRKIEVPLQNGKELKPIMIKPSMGRMIKPMAQPTNKSGDGAKANLMKGVTITSSDPMKDAINKAARYGKLTAQLMKVGDVEGAKAANEAKIKAAQEAKDIEFARLQGGKINKLTLR